MTDQDLGAVDQVVGRGRGDRQLADRYLTLQQLEEYSSISLRQLKRYLALPTEDRLPHVRNGRRPLVLRSAFDAWIAGGRARQLAAPRGRSFGEIMQEFRARKPLAKSRPRAKPQLDVAVPADTSAVRPHHG